MTWKKIRGLALYSSWYLPLIEAGKSMPDAVGGRYAGGQRQCRHGGRHERS